MLIRCPVCRSGHRTYHSLKIHLMKVHLDERPYECKPCSLRFASFAGLKRHCRVAHPSSRLFDIIDYHNSRLDSIASSTTTPQTSASSSSSSSFSSSSSSSCCSGQVNSGNVRYVNFLNKFRFTEFIYQNDEEEEEENDQDDYCDDTETTASNPSLIVSVRVSSSPIECVTCSARFGCTAEMLCHMWIKHMRASRLVCWLCSSSSASSLSSPTSSFDTKTDLIQHLNEKHLNSELK